MFSKQTVSTIIAPSGSFGGAGTINLNNPCLPANLRNQFCGFNTTQAVGTYTPRFTQAECDAAAAAPGRTNADGSANADYREVTVTLNRRTPEVGPRVSDYQTTFFDYRVGARGGITDRSEEHTSELQSLMRISYAVFCLKK